MSELLFSWRGNFCYSPSAHYQVCWTFLRSSWCWAMPEKMNSLACHITNASSSLEWVTEQKLAVSWSRNCCTSHIFCLWINSTSVPLRILLALESQALGIWGIRDISDAKESQQPVWKGMVPSVVWISKSEELIPIISTFSTVVFCIFLKII